MKVFVLVVVVAACLMIQLGYSKAEEDAYIDVEAFIALTKPKSIKEYERTPKAEDFLNVDTIEAKKPCLFKEADSSVLSKESEESFKASFLNLVLYGNMVELVRDSRNEKAQPNKIVSKINLRKFFKQIDEYALETTMQFPLPTELRISMDLPKQLNNIILSTKYESLDLQIHLNYENYSPAEISEFDQLICSIKQEASIWLGEPAKLKGKKESFEVALKPGQCLFVPNNWLLAVKTTEAWLASFKWHSLVDPIQKAEDTETDTAPIKLLGLIFSKDLSTPYYQFITHLVNYFNNPEIGFDETPMNKTAFVAKIKTDQVINTGILNWDQKSTDLIYKLLKLLDINRDGSFGLDDIEQLDQISASQLNEKIQGITDAFAKIQQEQVELLKTLIEDWKARTPELDMRKQLAQMFKVKINEWYENLSETEKEEIKAKNIDMNTLIDQMLDSNVAPEEGATDEQSRERLKQKLIDENRERQKQRESNSGSDNSMFEDEKPPATIKSTDDDIDEIFADDDEDEEPLSNSDEAKSEKSEL